MAKSKTFEVADSGQAGPDVSTILSTLESSASENPELVSDVANYIIQQCNDASLRGQLDFLQYKIILGKAIEGLYVVVYLDHYPNEPEELVKCDKVFIAAANFVSMLYTRVHKGLDYSALIEEIKARQPLLLGGVGGSQPSQGAR